jgi:hypothetical protein
MPLDRDELLQFLASLPWKQDHAGYAIIKRSHVVVFASQNGRIVGPKELVHHKNEIKSDDRPENLEVMTKSEHMHLHGQGNPGPSGQTIHSQEHKERLRQRMLGNRYGSRVRTVEEKERDRERMLRMWRERREGKRSMPAPGGRKAPLAEETKRKIAAKAIGRVRSEEAKQRTSESLKRFHETKRALKDSATLH